MLMSELHSLRTLEHETMRRLNPWHWTTVPFRSPGFWELGVESLPELREVWTNIGLAIRGNRLSTDEPQATPPDNCFCDGATHETHGAACVGRPALDCGFAKDGGRWGPPVGLSADVVACIRAVAKLGSVTNLTITNGAASGLDLGDAEYTAIGDALGSEPLASRLLSVTILDQREEGCTEGDAGLAGLGRGLQAMRRLRAFSLDNRDSNGLGSLTCSPAAPPGPPALLNGLGSLGNSLGSLGDSLRVVDINLDGRNGGYAICDTDVAAFATLGVQRLRNLQSLSLGLSDHEFGDGGATALGLALGALPQLHGLNLRLKGAQVVSGHRRGVNISAAGLSALVDGFGHAAQLRSLALVLGDGAQPLGDRGLDGLAAGVGRLSALEALWLRFEDDDSRPPPDATALKHALANLNQLEALHSDIRCLYCSEPAPFGCHSGAGRGTLAPALRPGAKCLECNKSPRSDQCTCWETQAGHCSPCDRGNFVLNQSSCTDF